MKPSELLRKGYELLSDPNKVTTGWFARNEFGERVDACDEEAVCWCSMGALEKLAPGDENRALRVDAQCFLHRAIGDPAFGKSLLFIADWNDATFSAYSPTAAEEPAVRHAQLLRVWDKATQLAQKAERAWEVA